MTRLGAAAAARWPWALVPGAVLGAGLLLVLGFLGASADGADRAALVGFLEPRLAVVVLAWAGASLALGVLGLRLHEALIAAPRRLAERARVVVAAFDAPLPEPVGHVAADGLLEVVQALAAERRSLREDMQRQVREASRDIEQERNRLAALMSELTQAVVVCNLDGRILLYNSRARQQFRALSDAPDLAGGGHALLGLGRSIHAVLDRALVDHALQGVVERLQRGAADPAVQFVTTTPGGQLLSVQMAPVRSVLDGKETPAASALPALNGFVLMLQNITRSFEEDSERDRQLERLSEGSRASLGALQAAVEMLELPDLDARSREGFQAVIREEVARMADRLREVSRQTTGNPGTRWPLSDMRGRDLTAAAARRLQSLDGLQVRVDEAPADLWLRVDSFSLLQALGFLGGRLHDEFGIRRLSLRLSRAERPEGTGGAARAHLDLVWAGQAMSTETVMSWELDPMVSTAASPGAGTGTALSVRDVVDRHGGAFWFERERTRHEAFFRFLLPLAGEPEGAAAAEPARPASRPEYYDFDLFAASPQAHDLADTPLADLAYTVFDTETTGLNPSQGDEILQIGATRIVGGKLRRQESFEQLVDPQRDIPPAGIPIHGITPSMVVGQPTVAQVLPAFHAFARDTVLVAHNAAFDMRFLQLKEAGTGVRFDQPVLDTLLLSAVAHPEQPSHALEAIAERLGVAIHGRHTALGDAMVTAEVFLKLLPLLAGRGIVTLGQAREAAQRTQYARLQY